MTTNVIVKKNNLRMYDNKKRPIFTGLLILLFHYEKNRPLFVTVWKNIFYGAVLTILKIKIVFYKNQL